MYTFISDLHESSLAQNAANDNDEETRSSEALQGDTALIHRVIELNELRKYADKRAV